MPHDLVRQPYLTEEEALESAANVVMAACAVLSIVGAVFSWWYSNASKKARDAAEKADANATRQREAIEKIAEALNPAPAEHAFSVNGKAKTPSCYATPGLPPSQSTQSPTTPRDSSLSHTRSRSTPAAANASTRPP